MTFASFTPLARSTQMQAPPERIHNWLDLNLSIARHYGGITFNGHDYKIVPTEPSCPLVRIDVLAREAKERKKAAKAAQQAVASKQGALL